MTNLSIGIPVFNEEMNIIPLLNSIKRQNSNFNLNQIIIYNDGSTDRTDSMISGVLEQNNWFKEKIVYINPEKNIGKSGALRSIFDAFSGDLLILIDSDVILTDEDTLSRMIKPFSDNSKLGLVGGLGFSNPSNKVLSMVFDFSAKMAEEIGKLKPLYICWGGILCLRNELIKGIDLPIGLTRIDAFLYLITVQNGFEFTYLTDVRVKETKDFGEMSFFQFARMQKRVTNFPLVFAKLFKSEFLSKEIDIPKLYIVKSLVITAIKNPIKTVFYLSFKLTAYLMNRFKPKNTDALWRK